MVLVGLGLWLTVRGRRPAKVAKALRWKTIATAFEEGKAKTVARDPGGSSGFGRAATTGFDGVVCFRGNAQRNCYGGGPVPRGNLRVLWRRTIGADAAEPQWNGVGWTGQPLVVEWPADTRRHMNFLEPPGPAAELIVGAIDGAVHFFDAVSGRPSRPALKLSPRNPIKGTVGLDPRGWPLLYVGTALPRGRAGYHVYSLLDYRELAFVPGRNPQAPRGWPGYDSNGLMLGDLLYLASENGLLHQVELHTNWDPVGGGLRLIRTWPP